MKKIFILATTLFSLNAIAGQTIVPLDMELGYWETRTEIEESEMIREMLASLPESQRAMVRKTMKSTIGSQVVKQCVTKESLADMEKQMQNSLGSTSSNQSCKFDVIKSNASEFKGEFNCDDVPTLVHTRMIDSKRHESLVTSVIAGMGENKIRTIGEWKSKTCPVGL